MAVNTYTTSRLRVNYLCIFLLNTVDKLVFYKNMGMNSGDCMIISTMMHFLSRLCLLSATGQHITVSLQRFQTASTASYPSSLFRISSSIGWLIKMESESTTTQGGESSSSSNNRRAGGRSRMNREQQQMAFADYGRGAHSSSLSGNSNVHLAHKNVFLGT